MAGRYTFLFEKIHMETRDKKSDKLCDKGGKNNMLKDFYAELGVCILCHRYSRINPYGYCWNCWVRKLGGNSNIYIKEKERWK